MQTFMKQGREKRKKHEHIIKIATTMKKHAKASLGLNLMEGSTTTVLKQKHDQCIVTTKILRWHFNQKFGNYRGSDVQGDKQFEVQL